MTIMFMDEQNTNIEKVAKLDDEFADIAEY